MESINTGDGLSNSNENPNNVEVGNEWWRSEIPAKPWESVETYLDRVAESISSTLLIDSMDFFGEPSGNKMKNFNWKDLEPIVFEEVKKLFSKIPERMPVKDMRNELSQLKSSIGLTRNPIEEDVVDENDYFKYTDRARTFNDPENKNPDKIIENIFYLRALSKQDKQNTIKHLLENKKLVLLGGGDSLNDLIQSSDFNLASVVNIDPFIESESIDKNKNSNYKSISIRAEDPNLNEAGIEKADEIWATWSVPLYLRKAQDIKQLFNNIDSLLVVGGICRIYPISLLNFMGPAEEVFKDVDGFSEREKAWLTSVAELLQSGNYNMTVIGGCMHLQKIA